MSARPRRRTTTRGGLPQGSYIRQLGERTAPDQPRVQTGRQQRLVGTDGFRHDPRPAAPPAGGRA
ncbi:hypothetical protein, partial [Streptomyces sp. SID6139]|uniref:hypothetical protein n=1 Tax=Streptomyces sp. SID6139 TaxID=2690320 RepID=UPI001F2A125C